MTATAVQDQLGGDPGIGVHDDRREEVHVHAVGSATHDEQEHRLVGLGQPERLHVAVADRRRVIRRHAA